jgi:hypothetical protein
MEGMSCSPRTRTIALDTLDSKVDQSQTTAWLSTSRYPILCLSRSFSRLCPLACDRVYYFSNECQKWYAFHMVSTQTTDDEVQRLESGPQGRL